MGQSGLTAERKSCTPGPAPSACQPPNNLPGPFEPPPPNPPSIHPEPAVSWPAAP